MEGGEEGMIRREYAMIGREHAMKGRKENMLSSGSSPITSDHMRPATYFNKSEG